MGVYGSGPYGFAGGKTAKTTTNECLSIDIRKFNREDMIRPGAGFTWSWTRTRNGHQSRSSMGVKVLSPDEMQLSYTCTIDGKPTPVEASILLDYTPCNYGKERPWFNCPRCYKRVAVLYLNGVNFRCRKCHSLTYYTCQESGNLNDMAIRRVNRILGRLKSEEQCGFDIMFYTPRRPRYMHLNTYQRLLRQYRDKQREYARSVHVKLASFGQDARELIEVPDGF